MRDLLLLLPDLVVLLFRLVRDSRVPVVAKTIALLGLGYVISPIDLLPDFFGPFALLDDLLVAVAALSQILNTVHPDLLRSHWSGKGDVLEVIGRVSAWAEQTFKQRFSRLLGGAVASLALRWRARPARCRARAGCAAPSRSSRTIACSVVPLTSNSSPRFSSYTKQIEAPRTHFSAAMMSMVLVETGGRVIIAAHVGNGEVLSRLDVVRVGSVVLRDEGDARLFEESHEVGVVDDPHGVRFVEVDAVLDPARGDPARDRQVDVARSRSRGQGRPTTDP